MKKSFLRGIGFMEKIHKTLAIIEFIFDLFSENSPMKAEWPVIKMKNYDHFFLFPREYDAGMKNYLFLLLRLNFLISEDRSFFICVSILSGERKLVSIFPGWRTLILYILDFLRYYINAIFSQVRHENW